jgi:mRNA-degrading endonuclease HigB of HigAB toxin-antitoxin module
MHLISIRNLRIDVAQFPDIKKQIEDWYTTVRKADWSNLELEFRLTHDKTVQQKESNTHQYTN